MAQGRQGGCVSAAHFQAAAMAVLGAPAGSGRALLQLDTTTLRISLLGCSASPLGTATSAA